MTERELSLWALMYRFEHLALELYRNHAPELVSEQKQALVAQLRSLGADTATLDSRVNASAVALLESAQGSTMEHTLMVQGLLLEPFAQIVYRTLAARDGITQRALCGVGSDASRRVSMALPLEIRRHVGEGEGLFRIFARTTRPLLQRFDPLGEAIDVVYGSSYGLVFAELVGELSSELLPFCTSLGMERRKVVSHITSAFMESEG